MAGVRSGVNIAKEGIVLKLAGYFVKTWEERWVQIRGRQLLYFKNEADSKTGTARQVFNLRGAKAFRAAEGKMAAPNDFCIEVCLAEPQTKSYYFCAESEEELEQWLNCLNEATKFKFEEICTLRGHNSQVQSLGFSKQGQWLLTGSSNGAVKLWDAKMCKLYSNLEGHRATVVSCVYNEVGKRMFTAATDSTLKAWDVETFQLTKTMQEFQSPISCCTTSPDGRILLVGSEKGKIKAVDVGILASIATLDGHTGKIVHMGFSEDGKNLVTISEDGLIQFWTWINLRSPLGSSNEAGSVVRSSYSGSHVAVANQDNVIFVWKWGGFQKAAFELQGHTEPITDCIFANSPGGERLITSSQDKTIQFWDLNTGAKLHQITLEYPITKLELSKSGRLLAALNGPKVTLFEQETFEQLETLSFLCDATILGFSPDGSKLVCGLEDFTLRVWSL